MATRTAQQPQGPGARRTPAGRAEDAGVAPTSMRQRRWPLALVAALVALGSALVFAVLWLNAGNRQPVLAIARPVPAGQVLSADDLRVVRVSSDPGIDPIPASRRGAVIGQTATSGLVPGSLLTEGQLGGSVTLLGPGQAVVGLALKGGQLPTSNLKVGDQVVIVQTPPPGAGSAAVDPSGAAGTQGTGFVLGAGRVFGIDKAEDGSRDVVVSLSVAREIAAGVVAAASGDRVSLVLVQSQ